MVPLASPLATSFAQTSTSSCRVVFGQPASAILPLSDATPGPALGVALPVLAGPSSETLLADAVEQPAQESFTLFRHGDDLGGFAVAAPGAQLESATQALYRRLFALTTGLHLYRVWNYVPHINAIVDGLENYRRFCRGRSLAFETHFGRDFHRQLPAASGVGATHGPLAVAFLAGRRVPTHFENPHQIPAFHYPAEYGPRSPSFSRATRVEFAHGRVQVFVSGTAAIRGHATIAPGDLTAQLDCTVENLRLIGETADTGKNLGTDAGWQRTFKIYLRHPSDLARVQTHLRRTLLRDGDVATFLQADLCRGDLLVEIEAVLAR